MRGPAAGRAERSGSLEARPGRCTQQAVAHIETREVAARTLSAHGTRCSRAVEHRRLDSARTKSFKQSIRGGVSNLSLPLRTPPILPFRGLPTQYLPIH